MTSTGPQTAALAVLDLARAGRFADIRDRFAASLRSTPHVVRHQTSPADLLLDQSLRFVRRYWRHHLTQQPL